MKQLDILIERYNSDLKKLNTIEEDVEVKSYKRLLKKVIKDLQKINTIQTSTDNATFVLPKSQPVPQQVTSSATTSQNITPNIGNQFDTMYENLSNIYINSVLNDNYSFDLTKQLNNSETISHITQENLIPKQNFPPQYQQPVQQNFQPMQPQFVPLNQQIQPVQQNIQPQIPNMFPMIGQNQNQKPIQFPTDDLLSHAMKIAENVASIPDYGMPLSYENDYRNDPTFQKISNITYTEEQKKELANIIKPKASMIALPMSPPKSMITATTDGIVEDTRDYSFR